MLNSVHGQQELVQERQEEEQDRPRPRRPGGAGGRVDLVLRVVGVVEGVGVLGRKLRTWGECV